MFNNVNVPSPRRLAVLVVIFLLSFFGVISVANQVLHLYNDHQNHHKVVIWVAQKQRIEIEQAKALEEQKKRALEMKQQHEAAAQQAPAGK